MAKGWIMLWVPKNPPTHAAKLCECENHPNCNRFVWGGGVAIRTLRGKILSLNCAWRTGLATKEEFEEAFAIILVERQGEEKTDRTPKLEKHKQRRRRHIQLPPGLGDLSADAVANAPESVRQKEES